MVVPRAPWRAIAVGGAFACGVHIDGTARCWGGNDSRQLGDGSTVAAASGPVVVAGPAGVTRVAAGSRHACAVDGTGDLWCWGAVLGDPGGTARAERVGGLAGVTAVGAGGATTCAVTAGEVWCLGDGTDGQLGGAPTGGVPVRVTLPAAATDVAVGGHHACALLTDATVACWGADDAGQRSGSPSAERAPARVDGLTGVTAVSAGTDHTCVLLGAAVSCFGAGDAGQLGHAGTGPGTVDVPAATGVSAGHRYTCVSLLSGEARCFGAGGAGQLGDGAGVDRTEPVAVLNLDDATAVAAGAGATTCALTRDGSLWCFGDDGAGQHGTGDDGRMSQPSAPIVGLAGTTKIAMGTDASCVVRDNAVWCWGRNRLGAAGGQPGVPRPGPVQVELPAGVVPRTVAVGAATACAATTTNELYCWGANDAGQAGQPAAESVGVSKVAIAGASEIAVGDKVTCARRGNGTLWCFGRSDLLGADLTGADPHPAPAQVLGDDGTPLGGLSQIAVGYRHACTAENYATSNPASGAVWCFGENGDNQLGVAGTSPRARKIPDLAGVINLAGGRAHTCAVALLPSRALWCFGANNAGQLGLGDRTDRAVPTAVPQMSASRAVAWGDVTCVKSPNAQGWCFGAGSSGQVGNGLLREAEPVAQVVYDNNGILPAASFATNGTASCAATTSGAVSCWGLRTLTSFGEGPVLGYPGKHVLD
ncbi:chromosome condensation regulator RCC1 [Actinoplanes sp. NBRC 14428]|nr:chromosome condensation regulator RCC1 [Actinoplanes sp. NBRC 14428]